MHPGDTLVGGVDGVVVAPRPRSEEVLQMAQEIDVREFEPAKLTIAQKSLRQGRVKYGRVPPPTRP